MTRVIRKFGSLILDLIFPPMCFQCGKFGALLCKRCKAEIKFSPMVVKPSVENCAADEIRSLAIFDGVIKSAIIALKYQSIKAIASLLGTWLYENSPLPLVDVITAVPLHSQRQRERGFNQAQLIAEELSRRAKKPFAELLIKTRATSSQAKTTSREERFRQLNSAFSLHPTFSTQAYVLKDKSFLIIDDVVTTGATLNECAKVLKTAGVKSIYGLAIAHGSQ